MDGSAFDRLSRAVSTAGSRRRLLGLLTSVGLGGLLTHLDDEESAAKRKHGRNRGHHPGKHKRNRKGKRKGKGKGNGGGGGGIGGPGPCTANGGSCQQNSDCCSENCFGQVCAAPVSQCGGTDCPAGSTGCCPEDGCCQSPANQCNGAELCRAPNCAGQECGADGCGNTGACGQCKNGQTCNANGQCTGRPGCGPQNCTGCCDSSGACQAGNTMAACGTDGAVCAACLPGQTCNTVAGQCDGEATCDADTCPLGCCDATGACHPGTDASFCGKDGEACAGCLVEQTCNPITRQCENDPGCNLNTCNGCCDAQGVCQPGDTTAACGLSGTNCVACRGSAATCQSGLCACTPNCQGKRCGDDGCGGSCGSCSGANNTCCRDRCTNLDNDGTNCGACGHFCQNEGNLGSCQQRACCQNQLGPGMLGTPTCSATLPCCTRSTCNGRWCCLPPRSFCTNQSIDCCNGCGANNVCR